MIDDETKALLPAIKAFSDQVQEMVIHSGLPIHGFILITPRLIDFRSEFSREEFTAIIKEIAAHLK